jgi:hypothetical protein
MITKFSVLYVGQIELDRVGRDGTPAGQRRYPNERLVEAFHTARDIAQHMDELASSTRSLAPTGPRQPGRAGAGLALRPTGRAPGLAGPPGGIPPPGSHPVVGVPQGWYFSLAFPLVMTS